MDSLVSSQLNFFAMYQVKDLLIVDFHIGASDSLLSLRVRRFEDLL